MATTSSKQDQSSNKLKRKATDSISKTSKPSKLNKSHAASPSMPLTHDDSSSSSTTSNSNSTPNINSKSTPTPASKSTKTAAIIAAANKNKSSPAAAASTSSTSPPSPSALTTPSGAASMLTEEEVRRYLSRKPMTTKELLHKFRSKTQNSMTNEELLVKLKTILDKLSAKIVEKNGVKYLTIHN
jgi:transcription initiation factor TFIIF subunit alpha